MIKTKSIVGALFKKKLLIKNVCDNNVYWEHWLQFAASAKPEVILKLELYYII